MSTLAGRRRAGLLIPLFATRTTRSWGIGDIGDVAPTCTWLAEGGQRVLQLLPINEMASGQNSPYSAITAMAIDPIFIDVARVPEFAQRGGESSLTAADRRTLAAVRGAERVRYRDVRRLKDAALTTAFELFCEREWRPDTSRARELRAFIEHQSWWVADYALYRAIRAREQNRPWTEWPDPLRRRDHPALDQARADLAREILFYQYLQWVADVQWQEARAAARALDVAIFGDLPFMVDGDSADVWSRQDQFRLDVSLGVPPDAFSASGQDWGMPTYNWETVAADDYRWLRARACRSAALFDGYRIDHLVGFYRTYGRPRDGGEPFFSPADEGAQQALGERLLAIFREPGAEIIAEDLGTVPDFVRASLADLRIPGFRVFRWERQWDAPGRPFRDPAQYPPVSVATSGTHDTEPMIVWWESADDEEKRKVSELATVRHVSGGTDLQAAPYEPIVRDALLEALFASSSDLLLNVVQDVFGWRDRINEPATVSDENWTYRLPWPVDQLDDVPDARERQAALLHWVRLHNR